MILRLKMILSIMSHERKNMIFYEKNLKLSKNNTFNNFTKNHNGHGTKPVLLNTGLGTGNQYCACTGLSVQSKYGLSVADSTELIRACHYLLTST